jgi:hypothetical protein
MADTVPITGTTKERSKRVILENPISGIPSATFLKQEVIQLDGRQDPIVRDVGAVKADMLDTATSFPLLNPADDSVIGSMTYEQFYAAAYSLFHDVNGG